MSAEHISWILGSLAALLMVGAGALWLWKDRKPRAMPLPTDWNLTARPVFSADERRVYRQLREALPHHIVLSKLPLVRFCQPTDPQEVRYWFDLLGATHVTFAVCSANGRVLAAIDLDNDRSPSRRVQQIKQAVLGACRVRYLRCPADHLPSVPELQLLVPQANAGARGPNPAPAGDVLPGMQPLGTAQGRRRREPRTALWQDSGFFQDSFFGSETRSEFGSASVFGSLGGSPTRRDVAGQRMGPGTGSTPGSPPGGPPPERGGGEPPFAARL